MTRLVDTNVLDLLERLAKGVVAVVGPHCEVVVHDFSDLEHSAVVVAGDVSGRSPGAPVPDLEFISSELNENSPDEINYRTIKGDKEFQSSTIWIRDENQKPIGAICINIDYQGLNQAYALLEKLTISARQAPDHIVQNTMAKDMDDLIDLSVSTFLRQEGIPNIEALSQNDKLRIIEIAEERGLFQLRGAAQRLADILNVSRASIYNYRANVKEKYSIETKLSA